MVGIYFFLLFILVFLHVFDNSSLFQRINTIKNTCPTNHLPPSPPLQPWLEYNLLLLKPLFVKKLAEIKQRQVDRFPPPHQTWSGCQMKLIRRDHFLYHGCLLRCQSMTGVELEKKVKILWKLLGFLWLCALRYNCARHRWELVNPIEETLMWYTHPNNLPLRPNHSEYTQ